MPKDGYFFDSIIRQKPIDPDNLNPEDNTEQYKPLTDAELDGIEEDARAVNTGEYAVFASLVNTALGDIAFVPGPDLTDPKGVRDVAEWYMLTASRPDVVHKIFERQVEVGIANLARIHARVGDAIDVLFLCGTDFGTQTSSFCSTKTFNSLWKPHYAAICDWIHANTTWKTFKHSCGASERFFESMIEAGIDIINPVQCSAKGMDPKALKAKYKGRLVFWGGGVDTQQTLPFGTPAEVRKEVLERCEIFSRRRRLRVRFDPQRPGRDAGPQPGRDVRRGEGVQRAGVTPESPARVLGDFERTTGSLDSGNSPTAWRWARFRAPLRQAINDEVQSRAVSYVMSQDNRSTAVANARMIATRRALSKGARATKGRLRRGRSATFRARHAALCLQWVS